jgi:hypothetical protein
LSFKLKLNNPSKISELQELEHWNTKFSVAAQAAEGFFSKRWIARNLFDLSEEEFLRNQRELYYDKYFAQSIEMLGQETMAAGGGGAGADLGALGGEEMAGDMDMEGDMDMAPDMSGDAAMEEAPPTTEEGDADTSLLAAPGKRDDGAWVKAKVKKNAFGAVEKTKTKKSKGWYEPVSADMRQRGARKRSIRAKGGHEVATMPKRQIKMNLPDGAEELLGLGKGVYESKDTNYNDEENRLFEVNQTVKDLIKELEQKDNVET